VALPVIAEAAEIRLAMIPTVRKTLISMSPLSFFVYMSKSTKESL